MKEELIIKNENYLILKLIYYIIFSNDINYSEYSYLAEDIKFLNFLKNIIEYHLKKGDFNKEIKNNIYSFLNSLRFDNKTKSIECNSLINDIIILLNGYQDDVSGFFYALQSYYRTNNIKYLFRPSKYNLPISHINESICNDFLLVESHSDAYVTDSEFKKIYLPYFKNNVYYYESLNIILRENPSIFLNKNFYNRTIKILEENSKVITSFDAEKATKKYIKTINSKIKKIGY